MSLQELISAVSHLPPAELDDAVVALHEPLTWRHAGAFACLIGAAAFMFAGRG